MKRNGRFAILGIAALTIVTLVTWWLTTQEDTSGPEVPVSVAVSYSFDADVEGWEPGFADYPADVSQLGSYELEAEWRELPDSLGGGGLYSRGSNRSDDLMMYWITPIEDLVPSTPYDIEFVLEVATNIPGGLAGIGGSPTESIYIKVGASTEKPATEPADDGQERLTIDIGSQSQDGANGRVVGTFENPNVDGEAGEPAPYALNVIDGSGLAVPATTDESGALWVIVAVDSGFEGPSDIYHSTIAIDLTPAG